MGHRGKPAERARARELRAEAWTLQEIADSLGVSKSSVSGWVRDVAFTPRPSNRGHPAGPEHPMRRKKEAELERCRIEAEQWVQQFVGSRHALEMYALALYAGEGGKTDGIVVFANSDPTLVRIFLRWLRAEFEIDEHRLRGRLYLHADLDEDAARQFRSRTTGIPLAQFHRSYRAVVDETMRSNRHVNGCFTVRYHSASLHRRVMARLTAVGSCLADPG